MTSNDIDAAHYRRRALEHIESADSLARQAEREAHFPDQAANLLAAAQLHATLAVARLAVAAEISKP